MLYSAFSSVHRELTQYRKLEYSPDSGGSAEVVVYSRLGLGRGIERRLARLDDMARRTRDRRAAGMLRARRISRRGREADARGEVLRLRAEDCGLGGLCPVAGGLADELGGVEAGVDGSLLRIHDCDCRGDEEKEEEALGRGLI